jgi:hypothetical protein
MQAITFGTMQAISNPFLTAKGIIIPGGQQAVMERDLACIHGRISPGRALGVIKGFPRPKRPARGEVPWKRNWNGGRGSWESFSSFSPFLITGI